MAESERIIYPSGVKDLSEDISTDDLVRRLKDCAQAFQNMSQDDDNACYIPLALYLASDTFLEHRSRDVRLLVACCIADVFRIYAPEAPYREPTQLKAVFEFLIDQLKGLKDPKDPSFKRYFYLLENFSCVHTFNLCVELEDNQKIMCHLFKLMFKIINEGHTTKVKKFMLDTLSPVIGEADIISQEFLDIILSQIIEPIKSQNKDACALAQDILKRNVATLEPYVQAFFNNALLLGKTLESSLAQHLYELMYELNVICPTMLVVVLPQLEFKLKSNEESERRDVIKVLTRMFSDKNSNMIEQHETLWNCLLSRFSDISPQVRILCVQQVKNFLLNHPESKDDITEQLRHRYRDTDENVRYEVVVAIISAAKEDLNCVNEEMLSFVKERTLDKKFKIRKEALLGLSLICKQLVSVFSKVSKDDLKFILWVRQKVLHVYYQTSLEDKLLVERIFHTCLVPYSKPLEERMKILYQLYCTVDDNAVKAFRELLKCQSSLRHQVRSLIDFNIKDKSENKKKVLASKVSLLAKHFLDPSKANEYLLKFFNELETNMRLTSMMTEILGGNLSCSEADYKVKEVLKVLGHPVQTNSYYVVIKQLFERIAPVMIDKQGIKYLIGFIKDSLLGDGAIDAELHLESSTHRGLELLIVLTYVFPTAFKDSQIYNSLLQFLSADDPHAVDLTLQIFFNISTNLEFNFPDIYEALLPMLLKFVETGTPKQAKHAVHCIHQIVQDKEDMFGNLIEILKKHMSFASKHFRTALVSFGHIAYLCHDMFASEFKAIAAQVVVKNLLMLDQATPRDKDEKWAPFESLPEETKCKIEGMKVMVRWLTGLKDMVQPSKSTLVLFSTIILNNGDLMERDHNSFLENAWMRLSAACCMLKLCQEPSYIKVITVEQFQILAYVMQDDLPEIRVRFANKIHKGLLGMKLSLHFLAILSLCGLDSSKEFKNHVKEYIAINVQKRREYIKQRVITGEKLAGFLPDYALPFAIHLLAHAPFFKVYNDVPSLLKIKECLWVLMEPLIMKNDNYSFSFFKRLLENIKQTKDRQDPNDQETNMRLYAVCDLALNLIMSKTSNFVLKDFPAEPVLPSKFFTEMDRNYSNLKTYLPPELICTKPSKSGFEIEIFKDQKETSSVNVLASAPEVSVPQEQASTMKKIDESTQNISGNIASAPTDVSKTVIENETATDTETEVSSVSADISSYTSKSHLDPSCSSVQDSLLDESNKSISAFSPSESKSSEERCAEDVAENVSVSSVSGSVKEKTEDTNNDLHCQTDTVSDDHINTRSKFKRVISKNSTDSRTNSSRKRKSESSPADSALDSKKEKIQNVTVSDTGSAKSTRSSRSTRSKSEKQVSENGDTFSVNKQSENTMSDKESASSLSSSEVQSMIKNCNVSLDTTTVKKYVSTSPNNRKSKSRKTLNNSTNEISDQENSSTVSDTSVVKDNTSAKKTLDEPHTRSRSKRNVPPSPVSSTFSKRKREESPVIHSEQSKNSQKIVKNSIVSKKAPTKVENVQNKNAKEENISKKLSTPGKKEVKSKSPVVNGNRSLQQPVRSVTRSKTQIPKESLRVTRRSEGKTSAKRR